MNTTLIENITQCFKDKFKTSPLVVNSPGRINIIGEHTDYNEGFVFPAAIDKSIVTAIAKTDDKLCSIYAFDNKESYQFSLENISSIKNGNWRNYIIGVIAEIQKLGLKIEPFNLVFGGDIPSGAGLSSSAALENSIVFGLNEIFNLNLSKSEMILVSQLAEHNYVGVKCGIMDQYASMFGVPDHALLLDCRTQTATPFKVNFKDYQLVLINTNVSHNLVDAEYNDRRNVCERVAKKLNVKALRDATEEKLLKLKAQISNSEYQKALYIIQENNRVLKAAQMMKKNDLIGLGELLFKAHYGAQHQFKISCKELDFLIEKAIENPHVIGARMMGGGFGGCTINIVRKDYVNGFIENISKAYKEKFSIESSVYFIKLSEGTHILNHIYQE
ncbi:MAG TPA: galactokinase [Flavobacteriaceae bacterium]|nr:galactokinase [Flavobacteriaceae bacterium]